MNDTITAIRAREVLDSRGNPTVEVDVHCADGARGRAAVPSGASTGRFEAVELRDGEPARYGGKGVRRAIAHVHERIGPIVVGMAASQQEHIDRALIELDGAADKRHLGANAILGVSLACARAAAAARGAPLWKYLAERNARRERIASLPLPMVNMISGGRHAGGNLDFQDFLLLPIGARSFSEALAMSVSVYRALSETLIEHGFEGVLVGDEGGFGPKLHGNEHAVEMMLKAIAKAGCSPGNDAALALDIAASEFYRAGQYHVDGKAISSADMIALLERWVESYPILSVEDGLAEDDWSAWRPLTEKIGDRVQLIGDDLFVTNPQRLMRGIAEGVANSVLVKPNQIGTLTETLEVIALAQSSGYRPVISARSGETEDTTIADLAVATAAGQIKIGSVARGERLVKYNRLLRIAEEMGQGARFAGWPSIVPLTR